jgi:hypothetical protein
MHHAYHQLGLPAAEAAPTLVQRFFYITTGHRRTQANPFLRKKRITQYLIPYEKYVFK